MLARAAGRRAHHNANPNRVQQLHLPFLYPSYNSVLGFRCRGIGTEAGTAGLGPRKVRTLNETSSKAARRSLATVVGTGNYQTIPFEEINGLPPQRPSVYGSGSSILFRPNAYDPASTVRLPEDSGSKKEPLIRKNETGVRGTLAEVTSTFNACLHVGRIERAAVILKRISKLAEKGDIDPETLVSLHNRYIRAALEDSVVNGTDTQQIHKWFELEIRNKGLQQNAETVAYMLKASLQSPAGSRKNRLVQRYMDMVKGDAGLEVLGMDILSAEELNTINHICPTYNLAEGLGMGLEEFLGAESLTSQNLLEGEPESEEPIPEVRSANLKGQGLKTLKKSLSLFSDLPSLGLNMSTMTAEEQRDIQVRLEEDAVTCAVDRWREESVHLAKMGLNTALQTKSLGARMWKWQMAMKERLDTERAAFRKAEILKSSEKSESDTERCLYGPFLELLPTDKLAAVTILSIMTTFGTNGIDKGLTLSKAILKIAHEVEEESLFEAIQKDKAGKFYAKDDQKLTRGRLKLYRQGILHASKSSLTKDRLPQTLMQDWPLAISAKVGAWLMSCLIDVAKIPVTLTHPKTGELVSQMQPAFSHSHQFKQGKKTGVVIPNQALVSQLKQEPVHSLLAKHLPMLVPPEKWSKFDKGGFISHPGKIMRIKHGDRDQRAYVDAAIDKGAMEMTFRGLDILGKTPWKINQVVFDTMLEAWNSGEAIAELAPENPKFEIPSEPGIGADPLERRRWIRAIKLIENAKGGLHSKRAFQNFQLEIARALRDKVFYFPHNIDFRGRAYPIPPYLNHMGADHCRGLLAFAHGKELGVAGLQWLKIHLANVFGYDKASLADRESFAMDHLAEIYDSASNPLKGGRWWLQAEDPWQALAACVELKNALESPDPTKFVSSLPVHQDGTCNGLQHYAALGGDVWGASQVNLEPGDKPADVYTAVANLVKESIDKDLKKGNRYAQALVGRITRKTVKQTVMTNVYGVTFVGARAQIRRQLVAQHKDLPDEKSLHAGHLASYVATKVFSALSAMFQGAHEIQHWLGECASMISKSITPEQIDRMESLEPTSLEQQESLQFKSSVIWTTPLQMPVVQPYRSAKSRSIKTNLQGVTLNEHKVSDPVNMRKQLQGFPPNFIHSLDASHMLLSALRSDERGLSFAAVHDSFWTHAADVPTMNDILRDEFIRLHTDDVVGRLAQEFEARYKDHFYLARVRANTPVYDKLKNWRRANHGKYFVEGPVWAKCSELILEKKRAMLLASSDPEKVKQGEEMVTPASIIESMANAADLTPDDLAVTMGHIGTRHFKNKPNKTDLARGVVEEQEADNLDVVDEDLQESLGLDGALLDELAPEEKNRFDIEAVEIRDKRKGKYAHSTWAWLPLVFPPAPKKASFLNNSDI